MVLMGLSSSMLASLDDWSLKASLGESELLELEDEDDEESPGAVTKLAPELGVVELLLSLIHI